MGVAKRLLSRQGRNVAGLHFSVVDDPDVVFARQGVYSGVSGKHMFRSQVNIEQYNAALTAWGRSVAGKLKRKQPTIARGVKFRRNGDEIYAIGFGLRRHGVFVEKGVGRGYEYNGGNVRRKDGGPVKRRPSPWFNPIMEAEIPRLTDIVKRYTGDAIIMNTKRMYIG
jgi:hypothetical protein